MLTTLFVTKSSVGSIATTITIANSVTNNLYKCSLKFKEARTRFEAVRDRIQSTSSILTQICNLIEQRVRETHKDSAMVLEITQDKGECEHLLNKVKQKVLERGTIFEAYEKENAEMDDSARHKLHELEQEISEYSEHIKRLKERFQLKLWALNEFLQHKK